jgi:hypothetical protein
MKPIWHVSKKTGRATRITLDPETGYPLILHKQDTAPIVESAKALSSNFRGTNPEGMTHVARIPAVIWQRLMQTGVAKDEKALNAWLNGRDQRVFRVDDGRKL